VEEIRKKHLPKEKDKLTELRKLHVISARKARAAVLSIGIICALIPGTGMSLCMTEPGNAPGSLAMGLVAAVYPLYNRILKKNGRSSLPKSCAWRMNC
jgi:uncharacterized protein (DUF2062 family)